VQLYLLAVSLVWAGTARNHLDNSRARRSELRAVAKDLGIKAELRLSDEAVLREQRLARERRKGGSPRGDSV